MEENMKTSVNISVLIALLVSIPVSAALNDGTWSKQPDQINSGIILDMCSTGEYLWLLADHGIARYHTLSGDVQLYPLSVLDLSEKCNNWYDWRILAGDNEHVIIFDCEHPTSMQYFNGSHWRFVDFEYRCTQPSIGRDGSVWVAKKRMADDLADTLLFFTPEGKREIITDILPDTFSVNNIEVDGNGMVWLAGGINDNGFNDYYPNAVYRFSGSKGIELIMQMDSSSLEMWKDNRKEVCVGYDTVRYICENGELVPDSRIRSFSFASIFDSDGNVWTWSKGLDGLLLTHITSNKTDLSRWVDTSVTRYNRAFASCGNNVYVSGLGGMWVFENNDTIAEFISGLRIWGTCAGTEVEKILFGKNEVAFLMPKINRWENGHVLKLTDGTCRHLPGVGTYYKEIMERADGSLVMSGEIDGMRGFFELGESGWQLLEGTGNLVTNNKFIEDRSGKIWAVLDTRMLHQTADGWELIDNENSNLHIFDVEHLSGDTRLVQDKDGFIWGMFSTRYGLFVNKPPTEFAAKTLDGYDWEIVTADMLGGGSITQIGLHSNGMVEFLIVKDNLSTGATEMARAIRNGSGWDIETIIPPENLSVDRNSGTSLLDSRGDLWLRGNSFQFPMDTSEDASYFFRYPAGGIEWIRYDFRNVPYRISNIIGEDVEGNIYFKDIYGEVVVYNRDNRGGVEGKKVIPHQSAFSVGKVSNGHISVEMSVNRTTKYSLSLFSLNGRLVAQLDEGILKTGVNRKTIRLTYASGCYFVRFKTPETTETVPLLLR